MILKSASFNEFRMLTPTPIGMPGMGIDPMAAAQGMFGGFGMNMNDMSGGMNMGIGFDASQGMYGGGWDNSQNNMWNGGPNNFNPTAFPNGMGPDFGGSGYGGYNNISQQQGNYYQMQQAPNYPNHSYQNGYHGPGSGYGRGMGRGRGRGYFQGGRGRGGFANTHYAGGNNYYQQSSFNHNTTSDYQHSTDPTQTQAEPVSDADLKKFNDELAPGDADDYTEEMSKPAGIAAGSAIEERDNRNDMSSEVNTTGDSLTEKVESPQETQLQGIPTIDSIDSAPPSNMISGDSWNMSGPAGGRGGYHARGGMYGGRGAMSAAHSVVPPQPGQGVIGAPAAPRAMREGFPNATRGRGYPIQGRPSLPLQQSGDPIRRYDRN